MGAPQAALVDVREMLCAQALAVVAKAAERLAPGAALDVRYSAEDVHRDLLAWAKDRNLGARPAGPLTLRLQRRG
jgi:TusA-related sulfurtransferase